MLKTIRMIIARKCVARRAPLIATSMEVYREAGITPSKQADEAVKLVAQGIIECGITFNDVYYKLKQV